VLPLVSDRITRDIHLPASIEFKLCSNGSADAVTSAIRRAIPDAQVSVEDLTGGGDHLQVSVVSTASTV